MNYVMDFFLNKLCIINLINTKSELLKPTIIYILKFLWRQWFFFDELNKGILIKLFHIKLFLFN